MSLFIDNIKKIADLVEVPYHTMTAVRFGNDVAWAAATTYILATILVPKEQNLIVFRTECFTTSVTSSATGFMGYGVPPAGNAWWALANTSTQVPDNIVDQTPRAVPACELLNVDNWLLFGYGPYVNLIGDLSATADSTTRRIRTVVYGFFVPGEISERVRNQFEQLTGFSV